MKNLIIILLFALSFLVLSCSRSYELKAKFDNVEGLQKGSEILVNGFKIGEVYDMQLASDGVEVTLAIENKHKIPQNSTFWINTPSLLGPKTIEVIMGKAKNYIHDGDTIRGGHHLDTRENITPEKLDTLVTTFFKAVERSHTKEKEKQ